MNDLTIRDLIDLVVADVTDSEERIQKMFEWYFERQKTTSQWLLGLAATLTASMLFGLFRNELLLEFWQITLLITGIVVVFIWGLSVVRKLSRIQSQFVATLKLYSELTEIRPFLQRYREEID